jgi:hypothetical protein
MGSRKVFQVSGGMMVSGIGVVWLVMVRLLLCLVVMVLFICLV